MDTQEVLEIPLIKSRCGFSKTYEGVDSCEPLPSFILQKNIMENKGEN